MKTAEQEQEKEAPCVTEVTQVNISIGEKDERVVLSFDKSVAWLEMTPLVAIKVAEMMKEKAIAILRSEPTV